MVAMPRRDRSRSGKGDGMTDWFEVGHFANGLGYVKLPGGDSVLVVFPGLADCFIEVIAAARGYAHAFAVFRPTHTVFVLSRRRALAGGISVAEMAADYVDALDEIVIAHPRCAGRVSALGMSFGGFVGLQLAAERPDRLRSLVLVVSAHRPSAQGFAIALRWIMLAHTGRWLALYRQRVGTVFTGWRRPVLTLMVTLRASWLPPFLRDC